MRTLVALAAALSMLAAGPAGYPVVRPGERLSFPADHGAHPAFRTEWWYVTGWLRTAEGRDLGFQVTFFRTRPLADEANPSAFAPRQVLFAHAALSDPSVGHLLHDQRIARAGFGLAQATIGDADVVLDDWRLKRDGDGRWSTHVAGHDFALDLALNPTQPVMLQGEGGYSRKGPRPGQASDYYSLPHLAVTGEVTRGGKRTGVTGEAWLDREWSSTYLDPAAVGWDWVGLNLTGGGALMAFRVRDAGGRALWAGGSLRAPDGSVTRLAPADVAFTPERRWRSPRTGAVYPVQQTVSIKGRQFQLTPLFPDQELDSRPGGPVYWEGAVTTDGGRGYLELTGYMTPLKL